MASSLVIGTAGHVDHGKSALVKALTGTDPDRLKEEQERGITIDLGFADASIGGVDVAFVDVPGHERFVRNMLAGAGAIDAVLLVVAADESVMPQTREHFEICRMLDMRRGIVALTKMDLVDPAHAAVAAAEVRELVASSFLASAPVVGVSARTGDGLDALRAAIAALGAAPGRPFRKDAVRLPIDRVFSVKGFGTVVTGTLISGHVREGDELVALPDARRVRVRGVQVHGRTVASADAPRRVALNLGGVDVPDLARGMTIAAPDTRPVTRRVDVRVEVIPGARPLRHGARLRVHHGTADIAARVSLCAVRPSPDAAWQMARAGDSGVVVPAGGAAYARLRLAAPIVASRGDRIILRLPSPPETIGGAVVLDPLTPLRRMRHREAFDRFLSLDTTATQSAAVWLTEAAARGMTAAELAARAGLDAGEAQRVLSEMHAAATAVSIGERTFDAAAVREIEARMTAVLAAHHRAAPLEAGMPREAVRDRTTRDRPGSEAAPNLFDAIVQRLTAAAVVKGADRLALASHRHEASPAVAKTHAEIEHAIRQTGLAPPDVASLAASLTLKPSDVEQALRKLVQDRRLARLGDLVFHVEVLSAFKADVKALGQGRAPGGPPVTLDVAAVKTRFGLSRKFAIPLLEWLDRERVTRRVGTGRILL